MAPPTSFENLPIEIVLDILLRLSDLESLDGLLRASPNAFRVFDQYGLEVSEKVLSSGHIHRHTQMIIRITAFARQGLLPVSSIVGLQRRITEEMILNGDDRAIRVDPVPPVFEPQTFPSTTTAKQLRGILATSRNVTRLALDCIEHYLTEFRRLKPQIPADPEYRASFEGGFSGLTLDNPETKCYEVHDIGPPTWVEEQLVYRAFWRLQLIDDIKIALRTGIIPNWPVEDVTRFQSISTDEVFNFEEMADVIMEWEDYFNAHKSWTALTEYQLLETAKDYLAFASSEPYESSTYHARARPWAQPTPIPRGSCISDESRVADHWNDGWDRFQCILPDKNTDKYPFDPWRRLGFAIWASERLEGYGLYFNIDCTKHGHDMMAWISVLPASEQAAIRRLEGYTKDSDPDPVTPT